MVVGISVLNVGNLNAMSEIDYTTWEYPERDLIIIDEMNGYVSEISETMSTFFINCTFDDGDNYQLEMPCSHVPVPERPYLKEGAYCRLRLYEDPEIEGGVIEELIFNKRTWSEEEINEAKKKAQELAHFLKQE